MACLISLVKFLVILFLLCLCGHSVLSRKVKRQGKVRSILRECGDPGVEGEDCNFLRSHTELWQELNSMRQQIRKMKHVQEPPKDSEIEMAKIRLSLVELKTIVTENMQHIVTLDRNITGLQAEDHRFRESLRHITEVDNMEMSREIEELRLEKEELQTNMEGLVQTVEERMQSQIDKLVELDQIIIDRMNVIETENLTEIHAKIDDMKWENEELRESVQKRFNHQKKYVDGEVTALQESLNNTIDLLNHNEKAQGEMNVKMEDDIGQLFENSLNLSVEIKRVEQGMTNSDAELHERIDVVWSNLTGTIDTMHNMDLKNRLSHRDLSENLNMLEIKTDKTSSRINQLEQNIISQHEEIHDLIENLKGSHKNLNSSFLDFQAAQEIKFNTTHEEVDSLRFGKEYVNSTLLEIIDTHKLHYNQTVSDIYFLRLLNVQHSQNLTQLKLSEFAERQLLLEQIEDLKENDSAIYSEMQQMQTTEDRERNATRTMIKTLHETDKDIYSTLHNVHTKLSGPFMMFTSYPSTNLLNYDTRDTLVFDKTVLNHGGYYDAKNGWFICPVHGIYQCFLSVWGDFDQRAQIELVLEKKVVMKAAAQPVAEAKQHGSNQAVFECQRGQKVWLRGGTFGVLYTDEYRQNSFTGILLHNLEHYQDDFSASGNQ